MVRFNWLFLMVPICFMWLVSCDRAKGIEWSDISPTAKKNGEKNPGVKSESGSPQSRSGDEFKIINSYDMTGEGYRNIRNIAHTNCRSECVSDTRCVAYTYNIWNQWCFLKDGMGKIFLEPASIFGIKNKLIDPEKQYWSIEMARYRKRVFPGHTFKKFRGSSFEECEESCRREEECVVFTHSRGSHECSLKNFAEEYTRSHHMDSGVKRQRK